MTTAQVDRGRPTRRVPDGDLHVSTSASHAPDADIESHRWRRAEANNSAMLEVYKNNWLTSDKQQQRCRHQLRHRDDQHQRGHAQSGQRHERQGRYAAGSAVLRHRRRRGREGQRRTSAIADEQRACTTIKKRGIRIAVLYTEYLPLPTNSWYNTYIAPFQPNIGATLQACASPGPLLRG